MDFGTLTVIAILCLVLALPIYGLLRIGIAIGAKRATDDIVQGFFLAGIVDFAELPAENKSKIELASRDYWYTLLRNSSQADWNRTQKSKRVGDALAGVAFGAGLESQARMLEKKDDEAEVRMERESMRYIAWLADYGFRIWTSHNENSIRFGERLPKEQAEKAAKMLETFERRIEIDRWATESEEEKDRRFTTSNDRMQRVWEAYGYD